MQSSSYPVNVFFLNTLLGLIGVIVSGISLYFVYRFCIAVIVLDEESKRVLLSDSVYDFFVDIQEKVNNVDFFLYFMALYFAFRVIQFLFSTANFESSVKTTYMNLQTAKLV